MSGRGGRKRGSMMQTILATSIAEREKWEAQSASHQNDTEYYSDLAATMKASTVMKASPTPPAPKRALKTRPPNDVEEKLESLDAIEVDPDGFQSRVQEYFDERAVMASSLMELAREDWRKHIAVEKGKTVQ